MTGLVHELQTDAMDPKVRLADLLRKARAVSVKLRASEIEEWLGREMNGYENASDVPPYRQLHAELKCVNPIHGLIPLAVSDPKIQEIISASPMTHSIGELEALVQAADEGGKGNIIHYFSPQQEHQLMQNMPHPMRPVQVVAGTAILGILESVRNRIFDWSLELEARGVLGEGLTFSKEERERATQVNHSHHYTTNIGSISGDSQLQQGTTNSAQSLATNIDSKALIAFVELFTRQIETMHLADEQRAEMTAELATLRAQAASSKPKASIIGESLTTLRHIIEASSAHLLVSHGPAIAAFLSRL